MKRVIVVAVMYAIGMVLGLMLIGWWQCGQPTCRRAFIEGQR